MSPRDCQTLKEDILAAVGKIREYVRGMDVDTFREDAKTIDAVIRNFIVIGEAAAHVPGDLVARYPDVPWRLMADMRNVAVHHYWAVEADVIWRTIEVDLPVLVEQLKGVL